MDDNNSKKVGANSFNKNTFFTLWFYSINICFPWVGICENNQGIVNKEEAENIGTDGVDIKKKLGEIDEEEESGKGGADKLGTSRVNVEEDPGKGGADNEKNKDKADIEEDTGRAEVEKELGKSGANAEKDIGEVDVEKESGTSRVDKPDIDGADKVERQLARR